MFCQISLIRIIDYLMFHWGDIFYVFLFFLYKRILKKEKFFKLETRVLSYFNSFSTEIGFLSGTEIFNF